MASRPIWQNEMEVDVITKEVFEEVKSILCDGCRLKVPDAGKEVDRPYYHALNGDCVRCTASDWRIKACELIEPKKKVG